MSKNKVSIRSSDKSKKGGLTASGRKRINKATGSNLKAPVTKKQAAKSKASSKRRKSFCARSEGQKKMHKIDCRKTPKKRICLARKRWECN